MHRWVFLPFIYIYFNFSTFVLNLIFLFIFLLGLWFGCTSGYTGKFFFILFFNFSNFFSSIRSYGGQLHRFRKVSFPLFYIISYSFFLVLNLILLFFPPSRSSVQSYGWCTGCGRWVSFFRMDGQWIRLLAETREFRHAETAKLPKLVSQSNSEMPKCRNCRNCRNSFAVSASYIIWYTYSFGILIIGLIICNMQIISFFFIR